MIFNLGIVGIVLYRLCYRKGKHCQIWEWNTQNLYNPAAAYLLDTNKICHNLFTPALFKTCIWHKMRYLEKCLYSSLWSYHVQSSPPALIINTYMKCALALSHYSKSHSTIFLFVFLHACLCVDRGSWSCQTVLSEWATVWVSGIRWRARSIRVSICGVYFSRTLSPASFSQPILKAN